MIVFVTQNIKRARANLFMIETLITNFVLKDNYSSFTDYFMLRAFRETLTCPCARARLLWFVLFPLHDLVTKMKTTSVNVYRCHIILLH